MMCLSVYNHLGPEEGPVMENWQPVVLPIVGGLLATASGFLASYQLARIARRNEERKALLAKLEDIYFLSQTIQARIESITSNVTVASKRGVPLTEHSGISLIRTRLRPHLLR